MTSKIKPFTLFATMSDVSAMCEGLFARHYLLGIAVAFSCCS
jgi:hypothetical protein